jgi:hypothetical protein
MHTVYEEEDERVLRNAGDEAELAGHCGVLPRGEARMVVVAAEVGHAREEHELD